MGVQKIVKGLDYLGFAEMPESGLIANAEFIRLALNLEGSFKMNPN